MKDEIVGEITVDLMEDIIESLPNLKALRSTSHSILIHGMGGQTRSFYNALRKNRNVELLWTGWSSNVWWTYLLSFIPGQAGLIKVIDLRQLDTFFFDIGQNSMCGLYFIPNSTVDKIVEEVKKKNGNGNFENIFKNEKNYFLLTVDIDFQGGHKTGEIFYRELIMGENLDTEIKQKLTQTEKLAG